MLIIAFLLLNYNKILEINDEIINNIQNQIYKETTKNNLSAKIDVNYLEESILEIKKPILTTYDYIAFLEIPKINLNQGLLTKTSFYNKVDYHIQILNIADYPDIINGNFILAGHSGTSNVAYFKNLYKLTIKDQAKVYYQSKVYTYEIVNIYNQEKNGSINIYRNKDKTTLTLITCTKDDKNSQTIYILELIGVETY